MCDGNERALRMRGVERMGEGARQTGNANWARETDDLLRGLTGGFLIGIPLLYTMETWWIGETISMPYALAFLGLAYALNFGFVAFAGFRGREAGARCPFGDALEATALAVVTSAVTLALLHQLYPGQSLDVVIGRIAVDAVPVSFGVSVANHILAPRQTRTGPGEGERPVTGSEGTARAIALDLGASFGGALFLSFNIAPTEEVPMLATEVPTLYLPVVVLFSLVLSYGIVFEAGFGGQEHRRDTEGPFQRPITETVAAYIVSLFTAGGALLLFGQIDLATDWYVAYAQVVLLGLPAAIGGAAGRLAV